MREQPYITAKQARGWAGSSAGISMYSIMCLIEESAKLNEAALPIGGRLPGLLKEHRDELRKLGFKVDRSGIHWGYENDEELDPVEKAIKYAGDIDNDGYANVPMKPLHNVRTGERVKGTQRPNTTAHPGRELE